MIASLRSLRLRLCLALAGGFVVVLGGMTAWVTGEVRGFVTADFDAGLVQRARQLAGLCELEKKGIEFDYVARFHPEYERESEPDYYQIWVPAQMVTFRSTWLEEDLVVDDLTFDLEPSVRDGQLLDGRNVRIAFAGFVVKGPDEGPFDFGDAAAAAADESRRMMLAVARGREHLDTLLARANVAILGSAGLATMLASLLVWWFVTRGLRPVGVMAKQVADLQPGDLDARVELAWTPAELAPIVEQVNAFVQRLRDAMQRERRFAGNVAHELRTPVAELRSLAAVATRWPDDLPTILGFFGDVRDIAHRMDSVITNLLLLARCHSGRERVARTDVALGPLVAAAWQRHRTKAERAGVTFRAEIDEQLTVVTDGDKLAILWENLIANAISHAIPGTEIRSYSVRDGGTFALVVENRAVPLAPGDLAHLAEPFWRSDEARAGAEHAGLGLALVMAMAELLEFDISFAQDADGLFRATVAGKLGAALRAEDGPRSGGVPKLLRAHPSRGVEP